MTANGRPRLLNFSQENRRRKDPHRERLPPTLLKVPPGSMKLETLRLETKTNVMHPTAKKRSFIQNRAAGHQRVFLYMNLLRSEMDRYRLKPLPPRANPDTTAKTEQNGTELPKNGTPSSESGRPARRNDQTTQRSPHNPETSAQLPTLIRKTEQNGTPKPENGTATTAQTPLKSQISNLPSPEPAPSQTEQNGTTNPENGTPSWLKTNSKPHFRSVIPTQLNQTHPKTLHPPPQLQPPQKCCFP